MTENPDSDTTWSAASAPAPRRAPFVSHPIPDAQGHPALLRRWPHAAIGRWTGPPGAPADMD
jgi:hypothetical protein